MVQEIERGLDELDLGFCHVKWIPDGDKNKKFLYYLANCACLIPIVFIMMFITLILQVLGKSTVVYPGFPMGERLAGNIGMFGGNGLGKSMIEQFWEEVVLLYEKLVQRKCKQHQVKLEKKYYHVFINGSRAKKLMQECEKNDSTGVALYCEGGMLQITFFFRFSFSFSFSLHFLLLFCFAYMILFFILIVFFFCILFCFCNMTSC